MNHDDTDRIAASGRTFCVMAGTVLLVASVAGIWQREAVPEGWPRFALHLAVLACLSGGTWLLAWGITGQRR